MPDPSTSLVVGEAQAWDPHPIPAVVTRNAAAAPDALAVAVDDRRLTNAALATAVEDTARRLRGLDLTDAPVAVWMDNGVEWITTFLALASLGVATVPLNTRLTPAEVAYVLDNAGAQLLVAGSRAGRSSLAELLGPLTAELTRPPRIVQADGTAPAADGVTVLAGLGRTTGPLPTVDPGTVGLIQYTSGTTGFPKGAMLGQGAMVRNGWNVGHRMGAGREDLMFSPMPFFHVGGAVLSLLLCLSHQIPLVTTRRFDAAEALRLLGSGEVTMTAGIDAMFLRMIELAGMDGLRHPRLRTGWGAAPPEVYEAIDGFINIFGLSENSPNGAMAWHDDPLEVRRDTCGWVQPDLQIGIVGPGGTPGDWLPAGAEGEILVHGWSVMQGYVNDPAATDRSVTDDGWLRTGDQGRIDAPGTLTFLRRIADTLRVGGEQVACVEVEQALRSHPGVLTAVVVGVPDTRLGEVPVACVQLRPDARRGDTVALAAELDEIARQRLASFKRPRDYRFLAELPTTESGKIQKFALRDQLLAELPG